MKTSVGPGLNCFGQVQNSFSIRTGPNSFQTYNLDLHITAPTFLIRNENLCLDLVYFFWDRSKIGFQFGRVQSHFRPNRRTRQMLFDDFFLIFQRGGFLLRPSDFRRLPLNDVGEAEQSEISQKCDTAYAIFDSLNQLGKLCPSFQETILGIYSA